MDRTQATPAELVSALADFETRRRAFAFNVKAHKGPEDLKEETYAELRAELGLEGATLPPKRGTLPLPFGAEWIGARFEHGSSAELYEGPAYFAAEQAWEDAAEWVRERFADLPGRVELVQDGRSGGWATLPGLDSSDVKGAAEDFEHYEEARDRLGRIRAVLATFESGGDALRLAREHGFPADSTREDFERWRTEREDELQRIAGESIGADFAARVRASVELVRFARECAKYPGPIRGDEEYRAELRAELELADEDRVPDPDELELPTEEGCGFSLSELRGIVSALEDFRDYCAASVEDFPRLVAWHVGANVYERELAEYREELADYEEARAKGRELRELAEAARGLLASVARVGELAKVEPGAADAFADLELPASVLRLALEGVADWPAGEESRVLVPLEGRRPAAPCAGCGAPVRFKYGSSEDRCGDCQADEEPPCGLCQGKEHGAAECPHGEGD